MKQFPTYTKVRELKRELTLRRNVYPGLISSGKLERHKAIEQYQILEAILADYVNLMGKVQQELFDNTP